MLVRSELVEKAWPHVWKLIEKVADLETENDILSDLKSEVRFLLINGDGIAILGFNRGNTEIHYVAGKNIKKWKDDMLADIKKAAEATDNKRIIALGKVGWKKIWPEFTDTKKHLFTLEI